MVLYLKKTSPSQDFVIGIIIDVKKIWQYIACMYTIDSGSIARYNDALITTSKFKICEQTDKPCWTDYLNNDDSKYLGYAGCGRIDSIANNRGLKGPANNFFINKNNKFIPPTKDEIYTFAFDNNKNLPFSKFKWKDWIKNVKIVSKLSRNKKFIDLQCNGNDGYRENEVDIIVPTKNISQNPPCKTIDEFKKVWKNSILGIFTNAKTNCSKKTGDKCYQCSGACCCNENYHINVVKRISRNF